MEEKEAVGGGVTTMGHDALKRRLSSRMPCCVSNCSVQLCDHKRLTPSLCEPVIHLSFRAEVDSMFTEPCFALPFIGWCGVKSKTGEAFRNVCFPAHSNFHLFQTWYFFGSMEEKFDLC